MDPEHERSSSARPWWLLIGGVVVFLVAFSLIENLVRTGSAEDSAPAPDAEMTSSPVPQVRRLDDGAIEIRHDFFRRTTIRLGNEDEEKALLECIARGFEQTFGDGVEGWGGARVRRETQRIQDECMGLRDIPVPPRRRHGV